MDFILAYVEPPTWALEFALILASEVERERSLAQILAHIEAVRSLR
jgi:hypothetical protein